jgi:DNA-binding protein H-NS
MSRYDELRAQLERLATEVEEARVAESHDAIDTCKSLIAKFGLSPFDLGFVKTQILAPNKSAPHTFTPPKPKKVYPPKYQNPKDGATWNGMGKAPAWVDADGDRDSFLIREPKAA